MNTSNINAISLSLSSGFKGLDIIQEEKGDESKGKNKKKFYWFVLKIKIKKKVNKY